MSERRAASRVATKVRATQVFGSSSCPGCGGLDHSVIGPIPEAFHFCALEFDDPVNPGNLVICQNCSLHYRWPCLALEELNSLYARQPETLSWDFDISGRLDFSMIASIVSKFVATRAHTTVLDIGCYRGGLLRLIGLGQNIGRQIQLFGVEPSTAAAEAARASGIEMIGATLSDITRSRKFDVVTMVDVFEHLAEVRNAMAVCYSILEGGGIFIVSTGASDSKQFQLWGNHYYYAAIPEHVVFISRPYAEWLARETGMELASYQLISHRSASVRVSTYLKNCCRVLIYFVLRAIPVASFEGINPIKRRLRKIRARGISNLGDQRDHALITFRKN